MNVISGGGACNGNDSSVNVCAHVWPGCLMLCALYQYQPRGVRKLVLFVVFVQELLLPSLNVIQRPVWARIIFRVENL